MTKSKGEDIVQNIYIVRHGQSEGNVAGVYEPNDSPLTENGKQQAKYIGVRAKGLSFEKIISSHYRRARETAEAIKEATGKEIVTSELFGEWKYPSKFLGVNYYSDHVDLVEYRNQRDENIADDAWKYVDEESFHEIRERVDKALAFLKDQEKDVVVVTHGGFTRALVFRAILRDLLTQEAYLKVMKGTQSFNTGLTWLQRKGERWRLFAWMDQAHLAEGED